MQDSYSELIKLLLPEIIVEYFEMTSYKKEEEILHLYLKEINSIPKEYRLFKLSSKGFFDEITVQNFQSAVIKYILISLVEDGLMKTQGKIVFSTDSYRD
ncbi:hypothetical protein BJQ96_01869 [Flavobacterium sp. PL0002]|nr:hypothetical protein [Flavobacterium sp. PL002]